MAPKKLAAPKKAPKSKVSRATNPRSSTRKPTVDKASKGPTVETREPASPPGNDHEERTTESPGTKE